MPDERDQLQAIAQEWCEARSIIKAFLRELAPAMSNDYLNHNAAAVIARLAHGGFLVQKPDADIAAKAERIATVLEANDQQGGLTHTEMVALIRGVLEE